MKAIQYAVSLGDYENVLKLDNDDNDAQPHEHFKTHWLVYFK